MIKLLSIQKNYDPVNKFLFGLYYPVFYRFGSLNSKENEVFEKSDSGEYEKDFKMKKNEVNLNQRD